MNHLRHFLVSNNFQKIISNYSFDVFYNSDFNTEYLIFNKDCTKLIDLPFILKLRNDILQSRNSGLKKFIIWEDRYIRNPELIESTILLRLGKSKKIHARDLQIIQVSADFAKEFMIKHHILGFAAGKDYLALVYPDHRKYRYKGPIYPYGNYWVVGMAIFGKRMKLKEFNLSGKYSQELIRFATVSNHHIIGGWSKLLEFQIKQKELNDIMTYVDIEWNDASGLRYLGFKLDQLTKPLYFEMVDNRRRKIESLNHADFFNLGNYKLRWNV